MPRIAHQLTGERASAQALALQALSRVPARTRRDESALDRAATAHLVRRRGVSRRRAVVVLAFGLGWDVETIAEVVRRPARAVRRDIRESLAERPEEEWRAELMTADWLARPPADFDELIRSERAARRRTVRARLLAVCAVGTGLVGACVAVDRVVTAPAPLPPTAHEPGLLSWPPRGELVRDSATRKAAVTAWRSEDDGPVGRVYLLYAGRLDERVTVVLQGRLATGPAIAVMTREPAGAAPRFTPRAAPLPSPESPVVAITTEGDVGVPVTRLLAAPDVVRVAERTVQGAVPQQRPEYMARSIHDGMSEPWVSAVPAGPLTSIRVTRADGTSYLGLLDGSDRQAVAARPVIASPPPRWAGLPARFSPSALHDDAVWFAQLCRDPAPLVQLTWVGRAPGFPSPLRVERVRCAGDSTARFLTGVAGDAITLAGNRDGPKVREAYAAVVTPLTPGHAYVVIVGSRRVADITIGSERRTGRVAVVPLERAGDLRVHARDGTLIALR